MFNPLIEDSDLTNLKDSELESKIFTLSRNYQFVARSGNEELCRQIAMLIDVYKDEQRARYTRSIKKVNVNNQDKDLGDLIKVN